MIKPLDRRLLGLLDQYNHAVLLVDNHNSIIFFNQVAERVLDHNTPFKIGSPLPFEINLKEVIQEKFLLSNGGVIHVEITSDRLSWNGHEYTLVSIKDISSHEMQSTAETQLFLYKTIADYTYDWEYLLLPDQSLRYISPSCKRITGYSADNFLSSPELLTEIVHAKDKVRFSNHLEKTLKTKKVSSIEFKIIDRNGKERWIGQKCQPVFIDKEKYIGCRTSNREITDIKQSEEKLQETLRKFRRFIAHSNDGILLVNSLGDICEWNNSQEMITGIKKSEVIGRPFWEIRKILRYSDVNPKISYEISKDLILEVLKTGKGKLVNTALDWVLNMGNDPDRYIQEQYFSIATREGYQLGCITRDITDIKKSAIELEIICENRTRQLQNEVIIRQKAEEELTKHLVTEHSLSKISRIFIQNVNLKETIPLVLQRLAMVTKSDCVSLYVNNKMGNEVETIYKWMTSSGTSRRIHPKSITFEKLFSFCINELQAGKIVNDSDYAFINEKNLLIDHQSDFPDTKSTILIPVISIHEFLGVIRFDFRELIDNGIERNDRFLEIISQIIGGALERGKIMDALEHQVKDRTQDINILYKIASLVSKPTDVVGILKSSLDILMDSPINIGAGFIHFQLNQDEDNVLVHYKNIPEESTKWITSMFKSDFIRDKLINTMRPIIIPDLRKQSDFPIEICMDRYYSYIGIPIWVKGRLLGILSLMGENFDELTLDNITLLSAVGDQIGGAIEGEYLRTRAKEAAVIEERQRLARELHDSVTQYLYSLILLIKGWRRDVDSANSDEIKQWFEHAGEITGNALKEMRLLLYTLHPQTMLDREGLNWLYKPLPGKNGNPGKNENDFHR